MKNKHTSHFLKNNTSVPFSYVWIFHKLFVKLIWCKMFFERMNKNRKRKNTCCVKLAVHVDVKVGWKILYL